jgi:DNA-binding NtrC family response regulator
MERVVSTLMRQIENASFYIIDVTLTRGLCMRAAGLRGSGPRTCVRCRIHPDAIGVECRAGFAANGSLRNPFAEIKSASMLSVLEQLKRLARDPDVPVLLEGESGTGKTMVARYLHALSPRACGPYQHVVLAELDDDLASSELFGHVKGAFTGAHDSRAGCFVSAHTGTIFLDEIGKASLSVQRKLLHAIEHGEIHPVGSDRTVRVDVRIIAASNVPAAYLVETSKFLPDLYARLEAFRVYLPPLRERREDIPLLVERYLAEHARAIRSDGGQSTIDANLVRALECAPWPNNMRQLSTTIRRLMIEADGAPEITFEHCRGNLAWLAGRRRNVVDLSDANIERVMAETGNNKSAAARKLGVHRTTLLRALRRKGSA